MLSTVISFASENYVSTLIPSCEYPSINLLTYETTATDHIMVRDKYDCDKPKRGYCASYYEEMIFFKKCSIAQCVILIGVIITVTEFQKNWDMIHCFLEHQHCTAL